MTKLRASLVKPIRAISGDLIHEHFAIGGRNHHAGIDFEVPADTAHDVAGMHTFSTVAEHFHSAAIREQNDARRIFDEPEYGGLGLRVPVKRLDFPSRLANLPRGTARSGRECGALGTLCRRAQHYDWCLSARSRSRRIWS